MKEPTGNTEAELQYWQKRSLQAEAEVVELVDDLRHASNEITSLRGQLEREQYREMDGWDD